MADFPSTSSAYGVWTLRDQREAKLGGNWPAPATPPGAPTSVSAAGGNAQATVSFTAPASSGTGGAITGYRVTVSPGGATATGSSSPITITGLTNGTTYTFTVAAQNPAGYGAESAASNGVTPLASNKTTSVDYLVVAGGGGGGSTRAGGGGAGGFRTASGFGVTAGSAITVTVGAGGVGGNYGGNTASTNGSNSVFSSITSTGGGRGASRQGSVAAATGGSGGGGGCDSPTGASGTSGQGNAGGNSDSDSAGAGGGGSSSAGQNASAGKNSGNGTASSISGSSVTYAGGGGGGAGLGSPGGGTGQAGGGNGGGNSGNPGFNATANTGSGGGGGGDDASGGNGGSGIVLIRYPNTYDDPVATTGSPTVTNTGGYKIYKWTSSGSITF